MTSHLKVVLHRVWDTNLGSNWFLQLANVAKFIVLTPLILHSWNPNEISLWYLFAAITTFSQLLNLGFLPTFSRYIAYAYGGLGDVKGGVPIENAKGAGEPNWGDIGDLYRNSGYVFLVAGVVVILLIGPLGTYALETVIDSLANPDDGWNAWIAVLITVSVSTYLTRYQAYLEGIGKIALLNRVNGVYVLISTMVGAIALVFGLSLLSTVWIVQMLSLFGALRFLYYAKKTENGMARRFEEFGFTPSLLRSMAGPALKVSVALLAGVGVNNLMTLVLAQYLIDEELASVLFAQRILSFAILFVVAPFVSYRPLIPRFRAQGKIKVLRREMVRRVGISMLGASTFIPVGGLLITYLLTAIHSNVANVAMDLWWVMSYGLLIDRYYFMCIVVQNTTNEIKFYVEQCLLAIFYITAVVYFVPRFGLHVALLIVTAIRLGIYGLRPINEAAKSINMSRAEFLKRTAVLPSVILTIEYWILGAWGK